MKPHHSGGMTFVGREVECLVSAIGATNSGLLHNLSTEAADGSDVAVNVAELDELPPVVTLSPELTTLAKGELLAACQDKLLTRHDHRLGRLMLAEMQLIEPTRRERFSLFLRTIHRNIAA